IQIWDLGSREPLPHALDAVCGNAVDFHPNGQQIAVGHFDGSISLHDLDGREPSRLLSPAGRPLPLYLAFDPAGRRIAVCNKDLPTVLVRDLVRDEVFELTHPNDVWDIAWSGDGALLAACVENGIHVWDVALRSKREILMGHDAQVVHIAFHPR